MGKEARRRAADLTRISIKISHDSVALQDCVRRLLMTFADAFEATLVIKEAGDDLLAWPIGVIIGSRAGDPRAFLNDWPLVIKDARRVAGDWFEFHIPDRAILAAHLVDMQACGLEPMAREFLSATRAYFHMESGDGWRAVSPHPRPAHFGLEARPGAFVVAGNELAAAGREALH